VCLPPGTPLHKVRTGTDTVQVIIIRVARATLHCCGEGATQAVSCPRINCNLQSATTDDSNDCVKIHFRVRTHRPLDTTLGLADAIRSTIRDAESSNVNRDLRVNHILLITGSSGTTSTTTVLTLVLSTVRHNLWEPTLCYTITKVRCMVSSSYRIRTLLSVAYQ
jgi:hypothetical protein